MFKKILIGVLVLVIICGFFLNNFLRRGLPNHSGELLTRGVKAPVTVQRDKAGIPHISASSESDAYFALGYAMAQDRLFQMEFLRAAGNGSLSEILGESMLKSDRFLRRIMLRPRDPEAILAETSAEVQHMLGSFLDGINTFIKADPDLPIEFRLLGHAPSLWDIGDMLAIIKLQAWQLSYNYDIELIYRQLDQKLGHDKAAELFPYYAAEHVKILDEFGATPGDRSLISQATEIRKLLGTNGGSNNWVVSGSRTASGKPILCSDPHLHGSRLPGPWYFAHLQAPGLNVAGGFFPGLPTALIGHNEHIAWGVTNMGPDVQDLFIEEINPEDEFQYLYKEKWVNFELIPTEIRIKDKQQESGFRVEDLLIKKSVHGPVVKQDGETLTLAWTGHLFNGEIQAFYEINHARDWSEFTQGLSSFSTAPQNFIFADQAGNIGYYGAGKVPLRKKGAGILPVPGWTGAFDWEGFIPFEEMPHLYNPENGMIVTANAEPYGRNYPFPMPGIYAPEYRTLRIRDLLNQKDALDLDDMRAIQLDQKSYLAPVFLEHLLAVIPAQYADLAQSLRQWDHVLDPNGFEGSVYHETLETFLRAIWSDDMGDELAEEYLNTWYISLNRWVKMLGENDNPWFDDIRTEARETRDDLLLTAFNQALVTLADRLGTDDHTQWSWGKIHTIVFHHPFESQGGLIERFFNYGPFPFGGDGETVNRATHEFTKPYMAEMTASMRFMIDMNESGRSRMANASGQVGMPLHDHYTDLVDIWLAGDYVSMSLNVDQVEKVDLFTITPR